jgi:ornithine carbamoyltransferase
MAPAKKPRLRHYLQFRDLSRAEYEHLFERTRWIKERFKRYQRYWPLEDRTLAMIFEKQSTRTRLSFEAGMHQLGGTAISRMCDLVMIRTYEQKIIERFAGGSRVPVINGLTNEYHPCQVLADVYTYVEHRGPIRGRTVAWIGDANNMCQTWRQAAEIFGFQLNVSAPPGYGLKGRSPRVRSFADPREAARGADLVTTDVWTSMGFEAENAKRKKAFAGWQVDARIMKAAKKDALFMHCLPAHRGEEVSAGVIDGRQSVVWDEAENRLHTQKALMEFLLLGKVGGKAKKG